MQALKIIIDYWPEDEKMLHFYCSAKAVKHWKYGTEYCCQTFPCIQTIVSFKLGEVLLLVQIIMSEFVKIMTSVPYDNRSLVSQLFYKEYYINFKINQLTAWFLIHNAGCKNMPVPLEFNPKKWVQTDIVGDFSLYVGQGELRNKI